MMNVTCGINLPEINLPEINLPEINLLSPLSRGSQNVAHGVSRGSATWDNG